jgi:hypothetical protein
MAKTEIQTGLLCDSAPGSIKAEIILAFES